MVKIYTVHREIIHKDLYNVLNEMREYGYHAMLKGDKCIT